MFASSFMSKSYKEFFRRRPAGVGIKDLGVGFLANPSFCSESVVPCRFAQFLDVGGFGPPKVAPEVWVAFGVVVVSHVGELLLGNPMAADRINSFEQLHGPLPSDHVEEQHGPPPKLGGQGWIRSPLRVSVQVDGFLFLRGPVHFGQGRLLPSVGSGYHDLDLIGHHRTFQHLLDRFALFGWTDNADPDFVQDVDEAIVADRHHVLVEYQLPVAPAIDVVVVNDFHKVQRRVRRVRMKKTAATALPISISRSMMRSGFISVERIP